MGWLVPVLAERGTPDQSYFQGGGAPSRAHGGTNPGGVQKRDNEQAWKDHP